MKGYLIVHGGGTTAPETTKAFIRRAGGPDAPIVILPQSSGETAGKGAKSEEWMRQNGAKNVFVPTLTRPDDPAMAELLKRLETASGVWMPGGDQNRFQSVFAKTLVPAALRGVLSRGGVVGGTSAGASLLGEWMPTGDGDRTKMIKDSVQTAPGLNLWSGVLVDTHFFARERWQRLANMVLSRPVALGLGVDENAWVTVDLMALRLTAEAGQVVLARTTSPIRTDREGHLGGGELRQRILLPGESVNLRDWGITG